MRCLHSRLARETSLNNILLCSQTRVPPLPGHVMWSGVGCVGRCVVQISSSSRAADLAAERIAQSRAVRPSTLEGAGTHSLRANMRFLSLLCQSLDRLLDSERFLTRARFRTAGRRQNTRKYGGFGHDSRDLVASSLRVKPVGVHPSRALLPHVIRRDGRMEEGTALAVLAA